MAGKVHRDRCLAWYDASLGRRIIRFEGFDKFLESVITSHRDVLYLWNVARKYQDMITGNARDLQSLTKNVGWHAIRGLVNLAKYTGCYEEWQKKIKQNGLRWKQADDSFPFFQKENITAMLEYVKKNDSNF